GVAVHDLVTDARIVDGLRVVAWPADGGRVTTAFQTASGAYAFRGLDGMARLESPPAADSADPAADPDAPPDPCPFVVLLTDRRARYLDTAFVVSVPTDGLVTRGDVLDAGGGETDDLPLYLFPSP